MADSSSLKKIIKGCKKGRDSSFRKLINLYSVKVYGYFLRLCNDKTTAEDLTSELFLKLVEKIDTFKGGSFNCWLFTSASNLFYDYLRKKKRQQDFLEEESEFRNSRNNFVSEDGNDYEYLQQKLQQLDEQTREIILLRYYSQMSSKPTRADRNDAF
jgi:RNA polymerase sigma-70 factor (ECF subfamily)